MSAFPKALPRSETKKKLLKHLNMPEEVYALLAKEADMIYRELVADRRNLKPSRTNAQLPFDWNDISERAREEAVNKLAAGGDDTTAYYWHIGSLPGREYNLPWLPVFFLYKTFRHRDGRARSRHSDSPLQNATYWGSQSYAITNCYTGGGTSVAAMQDPADPIADYHHPTTRGFFYDPVREEYIER